MDYDLVSTCTNVLLAFGSLGMGKLRERCSWVVIWGSSNGSGSDTALGYFWFICSLDCRTKLELGTSYIYNHTCIHEEKQSTETHFLVEIGVKNS